MHLSGCTRWRTCVCQACVSASLIVNLFHKFEMHETSSDSDRDVSCLPFLMAVQCLTGGMLWFL